MAGREQFQISGNPAGFGFILLLFCKAVCNDDPRRDTSTHLQAPDPKNKQNKNRREEMNLFKTINQSKLLLGAGAALFFCVESSVGANLIVDGSFESGPPGTVSLPAGSLLLPGWTITSGAIDVVSGFNNQDGIRCVDLDGFQQIGALSQTVSVQMGQTYSLSFWFAGNPDGNSIGAPAIKKMNVAWGGSSLGNFNFDVTGKTDANLGWTQYQTVVTATSAQMTLLFTSLDAAGSSFGPLVDNVSLTVVPEPQVLSLFGLLGVGGRFLWHRRK